MKRPPHHEAWLRQANRDIEVAEHLRKGGFHEWVCYCCQQAVEKGAKAIHAAIGLTPPTGKDGHNLTRLFEAWRDLLTREDPNLADAQATLEGYVTATRYPDTGGIGAPCDRFDDKDGIQALESARKLLDICRSLAEKAAEFSRNIRESE